MTRRRRVWLGPKQLPADGVSPGWELVRARVIRREYRTTGYRSKRTGRLVSAAAARRWPGKMAAVKRLVRVRWEIVEERKRRRRPPKPPVPPAPREEWEVTVSYKGEGKPLDITFRLVARTPGATYTKKEVAAAFWVAHKQGPAALRDWTVEGIDWQAGPREYHYPSPRVSLREAFENAGGIIGTVGIDGLRVDRVEL